MKPRIILVAAIMIAPAFAADITLTDGRTFKDAAISNQTPLKVVIKHAGGLTSVSKKQLPADLASRYPADEAAARADEKNAVIAREAATKSRQAEAERHAKIRAARDTSPASSAATDNETAPARDPSTLVTHATVQRALERYFTETFSWNPGAERKVEVTIGALREVPGWPGRWNTTGSAIIRNYMPPSTPVNTTGMNAKQAFQAEYRAARYTVETRAFDADYTVGADTPLNVTLR